MGMHKHDGEGDGRYEQDVDSRGCLSEAFRLQLGMLWDLHYCTFTLDNRTDCEGKQSGGPQRAVLIAPTV